MPRSARGFTTRPDLWRVGTRGTETQRRKCFTNFNEGEYPLTKIPETPLEGRYRGGGEGHFRGYLLLPALSSVEGLHVFLQEAAAFVLAMGTPMGETNAAFAFSVSLCLGGKSSFTELICAAG